MIGNRRIGLLGQALLMLGVVPLPPPREPAAPCGPGRQLRDERERVGEPLRVLAAHAGLTAVQIGEFERGVATPTPEQWAQLQDALPGLGAMVAATAESSHPTAGDLREQGLVLPADIPDQTRMVVGVDLARSVAPAQARPDRAAVDRTLHPAGRCTCGGEGECKWCEMDHRREIREARKATRAAMQASLGAQALRGVETGYRTAKQERRAAKTKRKARRGW